MEVRTEDFMTRMRVRQFEAISIRTSRFTSFGKLSRYHVSSHLE